MHRLIPVTDEHFAWMLGEADLRFGLELPEGGVEPPEILQLLRRLTARLRAAGCHGHWLFADGEQLVGFCGYKNPPDGLKTVEIGYGIAPIRRNQGYATSAVALLVVEARKDAGVEVMTAETSINNRASQKVLDRNEFVIVGKRYDADDGDLIVWNKVLASTR